MPEYETGAPYDRKAAAYDRLIPSRAYNRLLWGTQPSEYRRFALDATSAAAREGGPLLEVAGGTGVFTVAAYRASPIKAVLSDLSVGMLERARERVSKADGPGQVDLLQADALDLPFAPAQFAVVAAMGALHVFADLPAVLKSLRAHVAPKGQLFLSGLVAETRIGSRYLRVLHRGGEVSPPISQSQLTRTIASELEMTPHVERRGSMVYIKARVES
jgi:ubiquinone/menaquinone biosynthesis C-methylase UbiE